MNEFGLIANVVVFLLNPLILLQGLFLMFIGVYMLAKKSGSKASALAAAIVGLLLVLSIASESAFRVTPITSLLISQLALVSLGTMVIMARVVGIRRK